MIKILSAVVLISSMLYSQSFNEFLNDALKNSPYLQSSHLDVAKVKEENSILNRYKNPSLEFELSQFRPDDANNDNGFRANYLQPIQLWGVGRDKNALGQSMIKRAASYYSLNRAEFIRDISLLFTIFMQQKESLILKEEELKIAKKIYEISKSRYHGGTISKGKMLQAQVDYEMVKIDTQSLNIELLENYFELLKIAGSTKEIELDFTHSFKLRSSSFKTSNPDILYLQTKQKESESTLKRVSHVVEYIDLVAEYESEPQQDIFRVGVSIPLAIFNTKAQEKRLAKLQADCKLRKTLEPL